MLCWQLLLRVIRVRLYVDWSEVGAKCPAVRAGVRPRHSSQAPLPTNLKMKPGTPMDSNQARREETDADFEITLTVAD